jgi:Carboxypeptidase regulatory-like domain
MKRIPMTLLAILLLATTALAQFTLRSGVSGLVTDPSKAVMPNVQVVLKDLDRNQTFTSTTNESGLYSFANLTPGRYQVSVEQAGFRKAVSDVIVVASQETARVDLSLQLGEVSRVVEVEAAAPLLQTEQAVVGGLADRKFVETLPVLGRNFTSFVNLAPNISTSPRPNEGTTWAVGSQHVVGGVNYIAGGGGDNGFYMNGANVNDNWVGGLSYSPSIEAVSEVKADVANFSAANGRDVSTLNVTTRGGGSQYHGAIFDYLQNTAFNAWNPLTKALAEPGQEKDFFQRNQFGGSAGGPIVIPKVYNGREKAFFFVSYEQMIENRGGASAIYRVPTEAERQGDFSELLRRFPDDPNFVLYNPYSTVIDADGNSIRTPIPNNDLRLATKPDGSPIIDPRAQDLLGLFPLSNGYQNPTNPNDLSNYRTSFKNGNDNYRFDSRFDYRITNNDNVYVSFSKSFGSDDNGGGLFPPLAANVEDSSHLVTVNYARVFSPRATNEFLFSTGRGRLFSVDQKVRDYMADTSTLRNKYFQNIGSGEDQGAYGFNIQDYYDFGHGEVFMASNPTWQFSDNLSWLKGSHSLKLGVNYFWKQELDWDFIRSVNFDSTFTRAGSVGESRGGDSVASFLTGIPNEMVQRYNFTGGKETDPELDFINAYWGFFFEDKWQVNPKLTLSLGLRYDLPRPVYSGNRYGQAIVDFNTPGWQLAIPGRAQGLPHHYVPADKNNLAPRISLAYRLHSDFVVRASYGIFYVSGLSATQSQLQFGSVPGYVGDEFTNARFGVHDDLPYLKFDDIFPPQASVELGLYPVSTGTGTGYFDYTAEIHFSDKESKTVPYYQRYMLELQKGLGSNTVLSFSYLGGRGTKLPNFENLNIPAYRTGWTSEDEINSARPNNNGRFSNVRVLRHGFNSFYNAFTVRMQRNLSQGLQFVSHYTFSKTVADSQGYNIENLGLYPDRWDWNRHLGRGEQPYSHPHRFVSAVTYDIPWGKTLPALGKALLAGWNVSFFTTFESGDSLTITNEVTSARDFEPDRPNVSANPNLSGGEQTFTRYFNTGVFSAPPQDVKGNAGEGIVRGPGINNWDISLSKNFRPAEKFNIEFRAEFFNAFNHTQWRYVDTRFNDSPTSTFGLAWRQSRRGFYRG